MSNCELKVYSCVELKRRKHLDLDVASEGIPEDNRILSRSPSESTLLGRKPYVVWDTSIGFGLEVLSEGLFGTSW